MGDVAITHQSCVPARASVPLARASVQQLVKGGDLAYGLVYL